MKILKKKKKKKRPRFNWIFCNYILVHALLKHIVCTYRMPRYNKQNMQITNVCTVKKKEKKKKRDRDERKETVSKKIRSLGIN